MKDNIYVILDANRKVDETRKIEQNFYKVEIPRKIFPIGKNQLRLPSYLSIRL